MGEGENIKGYIKGSIKHKQSLLVDQQGAISSSASPTSS
jgi:hypothetical protein